VTQYDFNTLYGAADHSMQLYDKGTYDAVVTEATWGRTQDGAKGQWSQKFTFTTGPYAGKTQKNTITVSPDSDKALGIMFREMDAMQVPWQQCSSEEQMAQYMIGKPVQLQIIHDTYNDITRSKVGAIRPPRPGAPTQAPPPQQQNGMAQGYPGQAQPQYGQPQGSAYGPQQGQWGQAQGGYPQYPPQPQQPMAPTPYQQATGQAQPPQQQWQSPAGQAQPPQQAPPPANPAAPPWAQPPTPGQGGQGEFTQQGQSYQPNIMGSQGGPQQPAGTQPQPPASAPQPPWGTQQPGQAPQWQQGAPPAAPPGAPGQPPAGPWTPQQAAPNGYPQQPQGQQPQQGQPQQAPPQQGQVPPPPQPPWAQ
jgi:hypothetical protein